MGFEHHLIEDDPAMDAPPDVAAERLQQEIQKCRLDGASESYLDKAVGIFTGGAGKSVGELEDLQSKFSQARQSGDQTRIEAITRQVNAATIASKESREFNKEIAGYGTGFAKTVGIFMRGRAGLALTIGAYSLDQMKPSDSVGTQVMDGSLGALKGGLIKKTFDVLGRQEIGIAAKGVGLGTSARIFELGLTRETYFNPKSHEFSLGHGLSNTLGTALSPKNMVADAVIFGLAHGMTGKVNTWTAGALEKNPLAHTMVTGTTFGLSSGATGEIMRQEAAGERFDAGKVAKHALIHGAIDTFAAAPGGFQARAAAMRAGEVRETTETASDEQANRSREFVVIDGREALQSFRRATAEGPAQVSLVVRELVGGRTGKLQSLFVQHLGEKSQADLTQASKADLVAMCNPEANPGLNHVLAGSRGEIFMQEADGGWKVRFSSERPVQGEEFTPLGKKNERFVSLHEAVAKRGEIDDMDSVNALRSLAAEDPFVAAMRVDATKILGRGNESIVLEMEPTDALMARPSFAEGLKTELTNNSQLRKRMVEDINEFNAGRGEEKLPADASVEQAVEFVLDNLPSRMVAKITRPAETGDWENDWGRRPHDAPAYKIIELEDGSYLVLMEKVTMGSSSALEHLRSNLGSEYEVADPGITPQVGYSLYNPARPLLVDYSAVGRPGENRTIVEFTRSHELDEIYDQTGSSRTEDTDALNLARDGYQPGEGRAEVSLKLADTLVRRKFEDFQRSILEDIVKSPESLEQAVTDAAISRALSIGGNFEKSLAQAMKEAAELRPLAEELRGPDN